MSRAEARKAAEERLKGGQPHPERGPSKMLLSRIKEEPELFQFRKPLAHESRAHIHELAKTVKQGMPLEAVLIWWGGDGWYCIDGHHRLDAYRAGKWPRQESLPVAVFKGTLAQAILKSGASNMRPKLGACKAERTQAAWEQVCTLRIEEASAMKIASSTGVSKRTVCSMREVYRALRIKQPGRDLSGASWFKARKEHEGTLEDDEPAIDYDERDREEGKRMAGILARYLGERGRKNPAALAYALELYSASFVPFSLEHWQDQRISSEEDEGAEF